MIFSRVFILFVVAATLAAGSLSTVSAAEPWRGSSILNSGKGYLDTPMGQVSYRDLGPRSSRYTVVLMHQTPMTMAEFGPIQNALAQRGVRSIIFDTPGYGMSDHPIGNPTIADFADNLIPMLNELRLKRVIIGGHHTGASMAVSFAARHPDRVLGIVLNGTPVWTQAEADKWKQQPPLVAKPSSDGSHMKFWFKTPVPENQVEARTWMTIGQLMQSRDISHSQAFNYIMDDDLKSIKAPGLIITYSGDVVHALDVRASLLRPDFKLVDLGPNPYALMVEPEPWADAVVNWLKTLP